MKKVVERAMNHPFFSGTAIMVVGSMVANGINYVYHFIMGRTLGAEDYGTLAALYSLLYILSIVPTSSGLAIVKFISSAKTIKERNNRYEGIRKLITKVSLFGSILIIILTPLIANFLHVSDLVSIAIISPVFFYTLMMLVNQSALQGIFKFTGVVTPNILVSIVKLSIGVVLVYAGFSVLGAMTGVFLGLFLGYLYSKKLVDRENLISQTPYLDTKSFVSYSLPVLLQALAFTSFFSTDLILVKHFFTKNPEEVGLYAALSTLGKVIYFAAQPITGVMFPIISKKYSEGLGYSKVLLVSLIYTLGVCFAGVFVFLFFPKLAFLLYGDQYLAAADKLVWMGLFISIYSVASLFISFFLSVGKTKIVILPLIIAILQIIGIWFFHNSILQVIQISLALLSILCLALIFYFLYNFANVKNARKY